LLKWLGFGLAIAGGAIEASASKTSGTVGGPPAGRPVPLPVPAPSGRSSTSRRPTTAPGQKETKTPSISASKVPTGRPPITIDVIEGLDLKKLSKGMVLPILLSDLHTRHYVSILLVTNVVKKGEDTIVEFRSLQESPDDVNTGKNYIVTGPSRGPMQLKLAGSVVKTGPDFQWFLDYLENLAKKLETVGRKDDAEQVRREIRRLIPLAFIRVCDPAYFGMNDRMRSAALIHEWVHKYGCNFDFGYCSGSDCPGGTTRSLFNADPRARLVFDIS
jgi:hypothetical protein